MDDDHGACAPSAAAPGQKLTAAAAARTSRSQISRSGSKLAAAPHVAQFCQQRSMMLHTGQTLEMQET